MKQPPSQLAGRKLVVLEVFAQLQLVDFACSCVGNLLHKHYIFWHPPLGNLALHSHKTCGVAACFISQQIFQVGFDDILRSLQDGNESSA